MAKISKYTLELLTEITKSSVSICETLRKLGLRTTGGNHRMIKHRIRLYNIDISHFTGQSWSKGKNAENSIAIANGLKLRTFSNEEVFCENSPVCSGPKLRVRLIKLGKNYKCEICNISEWLNKQLTLHVDHINGINNDNRLENLRFLCPNCHQQTETWGNTKSKTAV